MWDCRAAGELPHSRVDHHMFFTQRDHCMCADAAMSRSTAVGSLLPERETPSPPGRLDGTWAGESRRCRNEILAIHIMGWVTGARLPCGSVAGSCVPAPFMALLPFLLTFKKRASPSSQSSQPQSFQGADPMTPSSQDRPRIVLGSSSPQSRHSPPGTLIRREEARPRSFKWAPAGASGDIFAQLLGFLFLKDYAPAS